MTLHDERLNCAIAEKRKAIPVTLWSPSLYVYMPDYQIKVN